MDLSELKTTALEDIKNAKDAKELEAAKVKFLGRKDGQLTNILKSLKDLSAEEKRKVGREANALRQELESALEKKLKELTKKAATASVDIPRPGVKVRVGHLHPLTVIENEIREIFSSADSSSCRKAL